MGHSMGYPGGGSSGQLSMSYGIFARRSVLSVCLGFRN